MKMGNRPEAQTIEYKSSWQDEYFEWICAYANAKGGRILVGVNDDGYVVGFNETRYLLDALPNQVVDTMGIVIDVEYCAVSRRGENIKYQIVPSDIAMKPVNLYARGILTKETLDDIEATPEDIKNTTSGVLALFDAAPGFVKQLRQSKDYRAKVRSDVDRWYKENPVYVNPDGTLEYVCITVPAYSSYGISYKGSYYIRSGSTTRELKGTALSQFLMERAGKHWDDMPVSNLKVTDLDSSAVDAYRKKAIENGRHTQAEVSVSDEQIISDLKLFDEDSGRLKKAAVLLFHPDPERYVTGASVKIAYFAPEGAYGANKSDDIIYHDEIHEPLMLQADKVVDLIYTKYLKALVSYEGLQRIETFMTPREAFREIILNSINHKIYESGNPIQISVYEDKIIVFNQGYWPEDINPEDLYKKKHSSYPHNPNIAKTFFNAGEIEAYGSGFGKIQIACDKYNAPYPELTITPNGVTVEIKACELYMKLLKRGRYWQTYPEYEESYLSDESGNKILFGGTGIIIGAERHVLEKETNAALDHMMEICSEELTEREKTIYLPIIEYLMTHETIKNSEAMKMTNKGASTVNRYLSRLVELNVLTPEGDKKGRIYRRVSGDTVDKLGK